MKSHIVQQATHQGQHNISRHVNFWDSRNWVGILNDKNKLNTKEVNKRTTKIEKFE